LEASNTIQQFRAIEPALQLIFVHTFSQNASGKVSRRKLFQLELTEPCNSQQEGTPIFVHCWSYDHRYKRNPIAPCITARTGKVMSCGTGTFVCAPSEAVHAIHATRAENKGFISMFIIIFRIFVISIATIKTSKQYLYPQNTHLWHYLFTFAELFSPTGVHAMTLKQKKDE
jgi:hypothetical protein